VNDEVVAAYEALLELAGPEDRRRVIEDIRSLAARLAALAEKEAA
jgi:hypothetical protein